MTLVHVMALRNPTHTNSEYPSVFTRLHCAIKTTLGQSIFFASCMFGVYPDAQCSPSEFVRATLWSQLRQAINSFVACGPLRHSLWHHLTPISQPYYFSRWIIYDFIRAGGVCCVSVNKCKCQSMWLESLYSFIYSELHIEKLKSAPSSLGSLHCNTTVGTKYELCTNCTFTTTKI